MIELAVKNLCSGCSACFAVCPKGAIDMRPDEHGFLYPFIDEAKCVSCGLCEKTCPVLHPGAPDVTPAAYAARTKDLALRMASTSGGIFTELAKGVLAKSGVVFGCILEKGTVKAIHAKAETLDELAAMRGSKYVQSDLRGTLREAKAELEKGRHILFSGTPCQIAGLNKFLRQSYDNLLTVEVICHGAPAPEVFEKFKREEERRENSSLMNIAFRNKTYSWKRCSLVSGFADTNEHWVDLYSHPYMVAFLANLCLRKSCHDCQSREGRSGADFTIADFWGIENVAPELDDDKGTSLVICHTVKAKDLWQNLHMRIECRRVPLEKAIASNPNYKGSCAIPKGRAYFMTNYKTARSLLAVSNRAIRGPALLYWVKWLSRLPLRIVRKLWRMMK